MVELHCAYSYTGVEKNKRPLKLFSESSIGICLRKMLITIA